jgi:hypothetical protein
VSAEQAGDRRAILGGAYNGPGYTFHDLDGQDPFARLATFSIRCASFPTPVPAAALAPVARAERDYSTEKPVGNETFEIFGECTPMTRLRSTPGAVRSSVIGATTDAFYFLLRTGIAVLYPVYKGTFERHADLAGPNAYRETMIQLAKAASRPVDYLETRSDIQIAKSEYYGLSLGATLAPVRLALDARLKAAALVLMLGGRYDFATPPQRYRFRCSGARRQRAGQTFHSVRCRPRAAIAGSPARNVEQVRSLPGPVAK